MRRLFRSDNDAMILQEELTGQHDWASKEIMTFNINKTSFLIDLITLSN